MRKVLFLIIPLVLVIIPLFPKAQETNLDNRENVFAFLKDAFEAQVSLSEQERSQEEIKGILNPYFTPEYQKVFWKENIHEENGRYFTYGSDFARYYIPYYQFSERTKVAFSPNKIYVYEYFPKPQEGPVLYKSHYEGILLKKTSGKWKVAQYFYNQTTKEMVKMIENY